MALADLPSHVRDYLALALVALAAGVLAGLLLGMVAAHVRGLRAPLLALGNLARVVPSLALLTFMLPVFGVGFVPAAVALALLATAPVLINTDLGFREIPPAVLETASALGMTPLQRLARVEWPLALPIAFAGVRTAATEVIASAVLASFIGAGGLGEYITNGLQANEPQTLWTGVAAIAAIAVLFEVVLALVAARLGEPA
ncbi:MAG TPA: ABC transporter permease subunit [Candidatus Baltobacteraceae bacterium]|nr:ABC transporter permease subunit [Candidatus Baltobacteraceae bacterium]